MLVREASLPCQLQTIAKLLHFFHHLNALYLIVRKVIPVLKAKCPMALLSDGQEKQIPILWQSYKKPSCHLSCQLGEFLDLSWNSALNPTAFRNTWVTKSPTSLSFQITEPLIAVLYPKSCHFGIHCFSKLTFIPLSNVPMRHTSWQRINQHKMKYQGDSMLFIFHTLRTNCA